MQDEKLPQFWTLAPPLSPNNYLSFTDVGERSSLPDTYTCAYAVCLSLLGYRHLLVVFISKFLLVSSLILYLAYVNVILKLSSFFNLFSFLYSILFSSLSAPFSFLFALTFTSRRKLPPPSRVNRCVRERQQNVGEQAASLPRRVVVVRGGKGWAWGEGGSILFPPGNRHTSAKFTTTLHPLFEVKYLHEVTFLLPRGSLYCQERQRIRIYHTHCSAWGSQPHFSTWRSTCTSRRPPTGEDRWGSGLRHCRSETGCITGLQTTSQT